MKNELLKEGDCVKFINPKGNVYFNGGDKIYKIQKRDKFSDNTFDMWKNWPGAEPKENYVYLIPDHIPNFEKNIKRKIRFVNIKYLKKYHGS